MLLTAAALATSRIRLGTLVTPVARRRPQQLARQVATLDSLSGGRVIFAAGLGGPIEGWPHRRPMRRAARWDGAVPLFADARHGHVPPVDQVRELVAYVQRHRDPLPDRPFEIVLGGATPGDPVQARETVERIRGECYDPGRTAFCGRAEAGRERVGAQRARAGSAGEPGRGRSRRLVLASLAAALTLPGDVAVADLGYQPDVAAPAVVAVAGGGLEVFVRGEDSDLVQRSWNGSSWSGWKNLGGDLTAAPAVTSSQPGRLDVFVRGAAGDLVHRYFAAGRWSGWINLGGDLTAAPAAVSPAPGRIDVLVRGTNGELVQRTSRSGTWGGWRNLGTRMTSAPAAVAVGEGRIELFARDADFHLIRRSFDGAGWSGTTDLGGDLTAGPAAAVTETGEVHVLVRGISGELVQRVRSGTSWSGWRNLGGFFTSAPAATATGSGLEVFVRGATSKLEQRSYAGGAWSGWKVLGGDLRGKLRARLRILTHNVYGLPGSVCAARGREFGWRVAHAEPAYDIVAVQEYYNVSDFDRYSCDAGPLRDAIWSTGRYRNRDNYYRHYPEVGGGKPDGGVGIFTLHPIVKFGDWRWDNDTQGGLKAAEGFIFARIKLSAGLSLDTYVVHLNSGGDHYDERRGQLAQLRRKIVELSRASGNPVLILGDFNMGGPPSNNGNRGHVELDRILEFPQDLWLSAWPEANGYTDDCKLNSIGARSGCTSRARIDYLLVPTEPALTSSRYVVTLAKRSDVGVVRWRVDRDRLTSRERVLVAALGGPPHVSDHFGVEATIEIRDR